MDLPKDSQGFYFAAVAAIAAGSGLGFLAIMGLGIWQWRRLALAKQRVGSGKSARSLDSRGSGGGIHRSRSRLGPDDVQFLLDSKGKRIQLGRGSFGAVSSHALPSTEAEHIHLKHTPKQSPLGRSQHEADCCN